MGDVDGQSAAIGYRVVAGVGAAQRQTAHRDGFVGLSILVGHRGGRTRRQQLQVVTGQAATDAAAAGVECHHGGAVVKAVDRAHPCQRDAARRDVDRQAGSSRDGVVAGVTAAERQAAEHHGLVLAGGLVQHHAATQAAAGDVDGDVVTRNHITTGAADGAADIDLHGHGAVIDAVGGRDATQAGDVQGPRRDAAGGAGAVAQQGVVAGIRTTQRDAGDVDELAAAHVLGPSAGEHGGFAQGDGVCGNQAAVGAHDGRGSGAVIDLGAAGVGGGDGARCDGGGGGGAAVDQAVVGGVGPTERATLHRDGLVGACIAPVGAAEDARRPDGHRVARHQVAAAGSDGGRCGAVINLVGRRVIGVDGPWRDVDREPSGARDRIVVRIAAGERQAREHHRLVEPSLLVQQGAAGQAG